MGLAEAIADVIDILRGRPARDGDGRDDWERMVIIIAENDSLPNSEVERIERAIDEACRGWSDAQRRSIWYETESGMADADDDDSLGDTSFNGIGYALQVEMLAEVTEVAWQEARGLTKAAAKRRPRRKKATE
jgi:hypothetical protein